MKSPVPRRRRRVALGGALAAALAVTAFGHAQPARLQAQPMERVAARAVAPPRAERPPSARHLPAERRILRDRQAPAAAAESAYLKKLTAGFLARCASRSVGCAIAAVGPHGQWSEGAAGAARRAPDPSPRRLTAHDKITMASVSKTFTGTALQKLLHDRKLSVDDKIGPYLLKHWKRSPAVDGVTFRQLLTHTSGLKCDGITYDQLKNCLETAQPKPSPFEYRNENFALMRILIPQVQGMSAKTLQPMVAADLAGSSGWIAASHAALYREYVNKTVFAPAGLPLMFCKPTDALPALSYKSATADKWDFSKVGPGEAWGDMSDVCGSQGWFLSAHQMARAMDAIMTPDRILPARLLAAMKRDDLAVYFGDHGDGLQSWNHGGYHPAEWNKGEINTLIIHFNNGVSAGVIINSPYGSGGAGGDYVGDLIAAVKAAE